MMGRPRATQGQVGSGRGAAGHSLKWMIILYLHE